MTECQRTVLIYIAIVSIMAVAISAIGIQAASYQPVSFNQVSTEPAKQDQYIIINVRLVEDQTGVDSFILDYSKNGEPMTGWFPSAGAVETYIKRLRLVGDVVDLEEPLP